MLKKTLLIATTLLFSACGGGGTSVEPTPLKTLYFIDSPVNGIDYSCGVRSGITKHDTVDEKERDGVLYCSKGTITFSLGSLVLGSIEQYKDKQEIRPQDLLKVPQDSFENIELLKMAQLIQSLDDDGEIEHSINIDETAKAKLTDKSLNELSLTEVDNLIVTIGKTPKELSEVKKHLIRNSSISYEDAKPTIKPFEVEVSTSSPAGFTIGKLSINEGKAPLTSLTLTGKGVENFQLNEDGTLILLKKIYYEKDYKLEVRAENIYGGVTQTINLKFKIINNIGVVQLNGLLTNATVKIIELNNISETEKLIYTETTSDNGTFNTHASTLKNQIFYIFEITNGINKKTNKSNKGAIRLISKGEWIKNANDIIRVTPLSEMQYDYVTKDIKKSYYHAHNIELTLNESAKILLKEDINGDSTVNSKDIIVFNPFMEHNKLYKTLQNNNTYQKIENKILDNNMSYVKDLFSSSILHSFKNTDSFKVVGSFAYVYGDNYFYIYDIANQKRMGEISLIKNNEDLMSDLFTEIGFLNIDNTTNVSLFLDLKNNLIFLSNLNSNLIVIDIENLNNPKRLITYPLGTSQHIIGRYQNILFLSKGYFYSESEKSFQDSTIKALNIKDIKNIQIVDITNLPYFDKINTAHGDVLSKETCSNDNLLHILTYNLSKIESENKVTLVANRTLASEKCNEIGYFDTLGNFYLYYPPFETEDIFKIYGIPPEIIFLYSSMNIDIDFIVNQDKNILYAGNSSKIFFIDISDPRNPYISKSIPFQYHTDNLEFQDDIFITKNNIIDLKSYILSSQYISLLQMNNEDTIDVFELTPFKRFSN